MKAIASKLVRLDLTDGVAAILMMGSGVLGEAGSGARLWRHHNVVRAWRIWRARTLARARVLSASRLVVAVADGHRQAVRRRAQRARGQRCLKEKSARVQKRRDRRSDAQGACLSILGYNR